MFEKLRLLFTRNLTVANSTDVLLRLYGDRLLFVMEEPLPYHVFPPGTDRLTYTQTMQFVDRIANVMRDRLGVKRGDRVMIIPDNGMEVAAITLAAVRIGAVPVPLNYMLKAPEIAHIADDCGSKVIFTEESVFNESIGDRNLLPQVEKWVLVNMAGEAPEGFHSLDILLEGCSAECEPADIPKDEPVGIFYTSGTTGSPKGAVLTGRGFMGAFVKAAAFLPIGKRDFGILCLPLAHMFGLGLATLGIAAGTSGYIMRRFNPQKVLEVMEEYKATMFVGVPAMYSFLLASHPEAYDLSHMRIWGSSTDIMPEEHIERIREFGSFLRVGPLRIKPVFVESYGMVELTALCTLKVVMPGFSFPPGCVGWALPSIHARIVDEEGNRLKRGEVGELVVKGTTVMKGYWTKPGETSDAFFGEWFRTGDMAKKDRWGRIHFVDRKKDVIKCGGYSIFSREVEQELLAHPDVVEAAVVGVPHKEMNEVPLGVVRLKDGSTASVKELVEWCTENIASYKAPRYIKVLSLEELPRGFNLKIMKKDLRERFVKEMGVLGT